MLLASNHMFPTGSIEVVFERLAKAGADGTDLFLPHVPFLNQPRFSAANLELCRLAAEAAGVGIHSMIACAPPSGSGFGAYMGADAEGGRAAAVEFVKHNVEIASILGA